MKKILSFVLIIIFSLVLYAQNQPSEKSASFALYVSFRSTAFETQKNATQYAKEKIDSFQTLVEKYSFTLEKGINISDNKLEALSENALRTKKTSEKVNKLKRIYRVIVPNATNEILFSLAKELEGLKEVEYVSLISLEPMAPPYDIVPVTPNYENRQNYLKPDPGVDMLYAWSLGLNGQNIKVRGIEYGCNMAHEELNEKNVSIGAGMDISPNASTSFTEHGTAVFGIVYADKGDYGVSGMAHGAEEMILFPEWQTSGYDRINAVSKAIENSSQGDVIIYEMQMAGRSDKESSYVSAEYNRLIWDLTKAATEAGIIIVAAAGNGNEDLDDPYYEEYMSRGNSGAIIVGAGSPDMKHTPLSFTTYGYRVDVQAWGGSVLTSGLGTYSKIGDDFNQWYTMFSGTSAATPIVASCVIVLQSYYHGLTGTYMTPQQMRDLLVETGNRQDTSSKKKIGPIPNMKKAIEKINNDVVTISDVNLFEKDSFICYPNPVQNKLIIRRKEATRNSMATIKLINSTGKQILSSLFSGSQTEISLEQLPEGIYFVTLTTQHFVATQKIIKK